MPISELSHRRPDQREFSPGKDPELLVGKANELWRLIAPDREPDYKFLSVASLLFVNKEGISLIPQSPEIELFRSILEPYLLSKNSRRDTFRLMLGINPAWYNYPEKNTSVSREGSFSFAIRILAPSWINPLVSVMDILERPGRKGILGFGTTNYDISVKEAKEPFGKICQEVKPISPPRYDADPLMQDELKFDGLLRQFMGKISQSVRWRKSFVSEVIDMFIAMAKETLPEQLARRDKDLQEMARAAAIKSSLKPK